VLRIGVQVLTPGELELAARRGRRVNALVVGWVHLSRRVSPELREQALGRVVALGARTGFRR
jgi:hypothetical protein